MPQPTSNMIWLRWVLVVVALVGLADASYLTAEHYLGGIPTCYVGSGCETVLTSQYATIFGMPVSLFGALYYLMVFVGALTVAQRPNRQVERSLTVLVSLGLIATAGFVYLQVAVLKAICFYCMVSAGTTLTLFLLLIGLQRTAASDK